MRRSHGMPFGVEVRSDGSARFRLWAPKSKRVDICLLTPERYIEANPLPHGWFEIVVPGVTAGTRYKYRIDGDLQVPDPASRFQPEDVHGPSEVLDPGAFEWSDAEWRGRLWEEVVLYELHVGAFSPEGTFHGVERKLDYLVELGVTAIELMPVADFPGERNWGYDGVLPFAPDASYGRPEDLKRLVQASHRRGMMIFLDTVYNHFGPEGNYLRAYSPEFFTARHKTPWGDAINFGGPSSRIVRQYFIHNALYWLEEFHFDGLRLDAVHTIRDDSEPDILTELGESVRQRFGSTRHVHLVLENDDNAAHYLARDDQRCPRLYDAQWNDDMHHAAHVLITGETDGYYSDYVQKPLWQLGRCLAEGFAFQGDVSAYRDGECRGEVSRSLPSVAFVNFLQNHDQIGNRAFGDRISSLSQPEAVRAVHEILLLSPSIPLLFMGEEFSASTPFLFFCDFGPELAAAITEGRRSEFARFARFKDEALRAQIPDPNAKQTFLDSKIDWDSIQKEPAAQQQLRFTRELLLLRKKMIVPLLRESDVVRAEFEVLEQGALRVTWEFSQGAVLTLITNLQSRSVALEVPASGQVVYSSPSAPEPNTGHHFLPWSVVWHLNS